MNKRNQQRDQIISRLLKKGGFKARIDAFCCSCIYDPYDKGTWRKQVENCTAPNCPLYEVRPVANYGGDTCKPS